MSAIVPDELGAGVQGQRITIRGVQWPSDERKYRAEEELDLSLSQARELLRLLTALIPLAEQAKPAVPVQAIGEAGNAA